ncbi:MAG TPA: HD domain-containing phosphohydrolase [Burkholderiales bacterium]|nr:HD domain-containing phosphohydrolase [Burkholderiales bacterium]
MEALKNYFLKHFEQSFVLLVLVSTAIINFFIPQKLAFLNFYFLPVILGAYFLGARMAVLGAFMCLLMVVSYLLLDPEAFMADPSEINTWAHITAWGGFLILAGAVVGRIQGKLKGEIETTTGLYQSLEMNQTSLNKANVELRGYSENLEARVQQRTMELEASKEAIEELKKKVEAALYSTMDSSVVNLMIEGRLRSEKRAMSVMFADLVGFTTYSESTPPENVVAEINRFLADMEPVLFAYHGHIDKYMGDGIMCEFGAPIEFQTHRLMALVAALKMQEVFARRSYPWNMRVGIASGSAITGLIGTRRQTYTAIGDIVNLAARLEKHCAPGRVLVDRDTYEDVKVFFEGRKVRPLLNKEVIDTQRETELQRLHDALTHEPESASLMFSIGDLYMQLHEPEEAMPYFERALALDSGNTAYKLAYAEAGIQMKDNSSIAVRGRRQRVEAFEVIGFKDPLDNVARLPAELVAACRPVIDKMNIPSDVTLPSEVIDGSIGHARVVAALAYALAGSHGLPELERLDIMRAGYLADIGKEVIPPYILNRRGGLLSSELDIIKQHPDEACRIMRKLGYADGYMLRAVRHSHERYDGSGYPEGLKGDAIPVASRIIAVADAYEALTAWRVHREPWDPSAALGELAREVEKGAFDPNVVEALVRLITPRQAHPDTPHLRLVGGST